MVVVASTVPVPPFAFNQRGPRRTVNRSMAVLMRGDWLCRAHAREAALAESPASAQ
jgi:hypothetical protein